MFSFCLYLYTTLDIFSPQIIPVINITVNIKINYGFHTAVLVLFILNNILKKKKKKIFEL